MFHFLTVSKLSRSIFLCVQLFWGVLNAQESSTSPTNMLQDESQYFAIVNETGGYINETLHGEFWKILQAKYDENQRQKIVADVQGILDLLKEFQVQAWKSAHNSYFAKKIIKTKEYEIFKEKLLQHNSSYFSGPTIVESAEKIIAAGADRTPLDLSSGKIYVTPELIAENMVGVKGSHERLKLLITPQWKGEYKEYIFPKMNISLLSLYSPDEYQELIAQNDEKIEIFIAQLTTDKEAVFEIGSVDYQKGDKKFINFSPSEREIYLQEFIKEQFAGYRIHDPLMSKGAWRGYHFAKGVAGVDDHNVIMMSFFVNNKALYIKYVTTANFSMASTEFNDFTKRIQILEKNRGEPI